MREETTYKWNWNNATDFANWISGEITDKALVSGLVEEGSVGDSVVEA